jgi:hypothetical protein
VAFTGSFIREELSTLFTGESDLAQVVVQHSLGLANLENREGSNLEVVQFSVSGKAYCPIPTALAICCPLIAISLGQCREKVNTQNPRIHK